MNREKQLVKNTIIITIGKVCTQLVTFFLLPLYTAILSTEEYGIVDLLNTYVFLLIPIITFQVEQAVFRFLIDSRDNENEKTELISSTIISVIAQCIIFIVIFVIIGQFIKNDYKYFLVANVIITIFSSIMLQISRGLGDNITYAKGSVMIAALTIIFDILLIVIIRWGAYGMLIASFLANLIATIYIFIKKEVYKFIKIKGFKTLELKKLWKYSIPLIPNAISWWIVNTSDRTIITGILGVGANGIYSAATKFSTLYTNAYNIFNLTWTESASVHINDKDKNEFFTNIITIAFKIFASICLGIIAVMPFVFSILINNKFRDAYFQIPILMLSALFNVGVGLISVIYIAKKLTKKVARTSVCAAIINIIVNLSLVKFIGLYAASISTAVSYFLMMIFRYFDVKKYVNINISNKLLISLIIMITMVITTYYINNLVLNICSLLLVVIYVYIINKNTIINIFNIVKVKIKK